MLVSSQQLVVYPKQGSFATVYEESQSTEAYFSSYDSQVEVVSKDSRDSAPVTNADAVQKYKHPTQTMVFVGIAH